MGVFVPPFCAKRRKPTEPIPNDVMDGVFFSAGGVLTHYADFAAVIAGVVFGAVHFIAWSFPFPTEIEVIMWRASTGLISFGPILYDIAHIVMVKFDHGGMRQTFVLYSIALIYLCARLFLVVEMFRTLFFLPPSAFAS